MTDETLASLIERYLEGSLGPADRAALAAQLREDARARESFLLQVRLHVRLGAALGSDGGEATRGRVDAILACESDTRRLKVLKGVERDLGIALTARRRPGRRAAMAVDRRSSPAWVAVIASAAVLLFAFLLTRATAERRPQRPLGTPDAERPAEAFRPRPPGPPPAHPPAPPPSPPSEERAVPPRPAPAPPAREEPRPETPAPRPDPPKATVQVLAVVDRVDGEGYVLAGGDRRPLRGGQDLLSGAGLETLGSATLRFGDGTRVQLRAGTRVDRITDDTGKHLVLGRGSVHVDAVRQAPDRAMILSTPEAQARVVGTRFVLSTAAGATRLEVTEGRVRLTRAEDGAAVEVGPDHYAVVMKGPALAVKPLPIDEVVLSAAKAPEVGDDWRRVKDDQASTGTALDAARTYLEKEALARLRVQALGYAEFTFRADAGKDYYVWIRGACTAAQNRTAHDMVILIAPGGRFSRSYFQVGPTGEHEHAFNGYGLRDGYGWVGGNADRGADGIEQDAVPVSVRFERGGEQKLRLYPWETPMRIDALWLSTTQKTRPDPNQTGPADRK